MAAALVVIEEEERGPERRIRDYTNPLESLSEKEVIEDYRLTPHMIYELCDILEHRLKGKTARAVPVYLKVLASLSFYADGCFLKRAAKSHQMSKTVCWRAVHAVTEAICEISHEHIIFPDSVEHRHRVKEGFYEMAGFPNVLGAIDGTLIQIQAPSENEHHYVCRKQFHAINVQAIGDHNLKLLNLVAKWPGSTHDAFIWSNSAICDRFEGGEIADGWLLGDSAYPLRPWFMTPILNPTTAAERRYDRHQILARNAIERLFGVQKMRFRCLHKSGGCLIFAPEMCCKIITAVGVLHNLCIDRNVPLPEGGVDEQQDLDEDDVIAPAGVVDRADGVRAREELIAARFMA